MHKAKTSICSRSITAEAAIQQISEMAFELQSEEVQENLNEAQLEFYVSKLVYDVLDYCHRKDFPKALIYSCVDLINKRIADSTPDEMTCATAPVSEIKMDDTTFKFAVNNVDVAGCLSDLDFASIKPKLNLYRKLVSM